MDITGIIAVLGTLSLSVERVIEILKNMIPKLATAFPEAKKEGRRRAFLQFLSALVGAVIAYVARDQIQPVLPTIFKADDGMGWSSYIILGLLASGGSGIWNHTLSIVEEVKKAKKLQVKKLQESGHN